MDQAIMHDACRSVTAVSARRRRRLSAFAFRRAQF